MTANFHVTPVGAPLTAHQMASPKVRPAKLDRQAENKLATTTIHHHSISAPRTTKMLQVSLPSSLLNAVSSSVVNNNLLTVGQNIGNVLGHPNANVLSLGQHTANVLNVGQVTASVIPTAVSVQRSAKKLAIDPKLQKH